MSEKVAATFHPGTGPGDRFGIFEHLTSCSVWEVHGPDEPLPARVRAAEVEARNDLLGDAIQRFVEADNEPDPATDLRDAIADALAPFVGQHDMYRAADHVLDEVPQVVAALAALAVRPVAAQERLAAVEALADEWRRYSGPLYDRHDAIILDPLEASRALRRALTGDDEPAPRFNCLWCGNADGYSDHHEPGCRTLRDASPTEPTPPAGENSYGMAQPRHWSPTSSGEPS